MMPLDSTASPAPPFAHGTNTLDWYGVLRITVCVAAAEARGVDGAGERSWPESPQAASVTTESRARQIRDMGPPRGVERREHPGKTMQLRCLKADVFCLGDKVRSCRIIRKISISDV